MDYKHGLYGEIIASNESIVTSKNIPVYVGIAPMHRLNDRAINKPILIRNLQEAIRKTGYSSGDSFDEFTLSAAIYAHFQNSIQAIGPIVIINVFDPSKGTPKTEETSFINGVAIIEDHVVIDSISISDKEVGKDYEVEYTDTGNFKITLKGEDAGETKEISISFKTVDPSSITENDIIGTYNKDEEKNTGILAIEDVYEELNAIPTIITAPGFNHKPKVRQALIASTKKITDKWEAISFVDIDSNEADTLEKAIKWKKENGYTSNEEKVFWPKAIMAGKEIWLSIHGIVAKMQTDVKNNNVPFETPSNKEIDISGLIAKGKKIKFSQNRANELNAEGITTSIYNGGKRVLWGPHMANFEYGVTSKPEEIFDVNIMMHKYLLNDFILRNTEIIDTNMNRHDVDALINSEQMILNSHVSAGHLLYGEVKFISENNPIADIVNGDFTINTLVTDTPIAKSITQNVQYTSKGIELEYGDEEEE